MLEEADLHIPVTLSAYHYHSHPRVTASVPHTGQVVPITILPMVSSCNAPTGFMSAIVGDLLVQSLLSIIVAIVLALYITKTFLTKPPLPGPPLLQPQYRALQCRLSRLRRLALPTSGQWTKVLSMAVLPSGW